MIITDNKYVQLCETWTNTGMAQTTRENSHHSISITQKQPSDTMNKKATFIWISTFSQNALICPTVLSLSLLVCAIFHSVGYGHYVSIPHFAHFFVALSLSLHTACTHFDVFISQMFFCQSVLAFILSIWCGSLTSDDWYLDLCLATTNASDYENLILLPHSSWYSPWCCWCRWRWWWW